MTNYDTNYSFAWGETPKEWRMVSFGERHHLNVLLVFAWTGMVSVFLSLAFVFVTREDIWVAAMIFSMVVWAACGIAAIRIRRSKRKMVLLTK